jgi:hypothetical protein
MNQLTVYRIGVCEVHKYALQDESLRKVFYCKLCDANICDACNDNLPLRFIAMTVRATERIRNFKPKVR